VDFGSILLTICTIYCEIFLSDSDVKRKENAICTSGTQQGYNTPSHGGGPYTLGTTPCEGVLCSHCVLEVQITSLQTKLQEFFIIEKRFFTGLGFLNANMIVIVEFTYSNKCTSHNLFHI
jgi:hypothetical protein